MEVRAVYEWGLCLTIGNGADLDLAIRRGLGLSDDASTSDVQQAVHTTDGRSATAQAAAYYRAYKDLLAERAGQRDDCTADPQIAQRTVQGAEQ